jgi:hemoglobin
MGRRKCRWLVLCGALALGGCAAQTPSASVTLYQELGGEPGVESIVETMLVNVVEDERVGEIFANSNLARLRRLLAEQFCAVADGPCTYSGFSMRESHRGMTVTEVEFNAVVQALADALDELDVPVPAQNRLLARLAPLRDEIVYQ